MILLIDNYDSFTYNLYQYLGELGCEIATYRNDKISVEAAMAASPRAVVVSPGPGRPAAAGITPELVRSCADRRVPFLGVCLGHQALGEAFGGEVVSAQSLMHGKTSQVAHDGKTLFQRLPNPMETMRYHSLVLREDGLPPVFEVSARNQSDGELMAIRHRQLPMEGVQFHPESIMTPEGKDLLKNFVTHYLGEST